MPLAKKGFMVWDGKRLLTSYLDGVACSDFCVYTSLLTLWMTNTYASFSKMRLIWSRPKLGSLDVLTWYGGNILSKFRKNYDRCAEFNSMPFVEKMATSRSFSKIRVFPKYLIFHNCNHTTQITLYQAYWQHSAS